MKIPATPILPTQSLKLLSHCWTGRNFSARKSAITIAISATSRPGALFGVLSLLICARGRKARRKFSWPAVLVEFCCICRRLCARVRQKLDRRESSTQFCRGQSSHSSPEQIRGEDPRHAPPDSRHRDFYRR